MSYPTNTSASDVWSIRDVYKARAGDSWPFPPPIAPTTVTATDGDDSESTVSFSGQVTYGTSPTFTVTSSPDGITATGSSSPITVTGLTNDTEYTFTVTVDDDSGSATSDPSNAVTPVVSGTNGSLYADSYLATTGGSLITVTSSGSINSVIDSANDGDAILLAPGAYSIDAQAENSFFSDPFRNKNVLICGDTNLVNDVVLTVDHDGESGVRDHGIFVGDLSSSTPSINRQTAFLTYVRQQTTGLNYASALVRINGDPKPKGRMVNCYFDNNGGDISWHYDNAGSTGTDVEFIRCTFANYTNWDNSYSGRDDQIDVGDCLFSGSTQTDEYIDLGGNVTSASIDETNRTYDTSTYSTSGHLYVPNTNAVFGPPVSEFTATTETFTYTGSTQSFTVPQGASSVTFKVWGAAGGSSQPNYGTYYGGAGGYSQGTLSVSGGESLSIIVGEGGIRAGVSGSKSAFGGGGASGGDASDTRRGAGGGGYSGVFLGSVSQSNALIIGGGGGGTTWSWGGDAGSGGYPEGLMGGYYSSDGADSPGRGGTQTSGGIGGFGGRGDDGLDGSALQGGDAPIDSGGFGASGSGGGGYFGGGSGALAYTGGGGGSSYTDSSLTSVFFEQVTTLGSDTTTAPNSTDSNYISGVAAAVAESDGGNGLVVLEIS